MTGLLREMNLGLLPEGKNFFWGVSKRLLPAGMTWELEEICMQCIAYCLNG
jgi:hypothetical protein